jgi:glyoxylase-like metal-dependent hydrolase (beta-lactamase superfamily II)
LHMDHVGWNTRLEGGKWVPTFPKASYLFGRIEWDHWNANREGHAVRVMEQSVDPVVQAGLHRLVETDHEVCDEVRLEPSPGHTPGHVSVRIASAGMEAVITGDLLHHPAQIARPEWGCIADVNAEQAEATRRTFVQRHADAPTLVIGSHFAGPVAGRIVRDGGSFRLVV